MVRSADNSNVNTEREASTPRVRARGEHTGIVSLVPDMAYLSNHPLGEDYGYGGEVDNLRSQEFQRLRGSVYLDNTGAALHSEEQMRNFANEMNSLTFANPHSQSSASKDTLRLVDQVRQRVLSHFNTTEKSYAIIFTSGTTASLRLIGESFDWSPQSEFSYSQINHNSVLGIREYATRKGASFNSIPTNKLLSDFVQSQSEPTNHVNSSHSDPIPPTSHPVNNLFCFPTQCNFSGVQFPVGIIDWVHQKSTPTSKWFVAIDVASQISTQPIDLSKIAPDFLAFSFYKIFGFPTGVGGLLVKRSSLNVLKKVYFGGGTVAASLAGQDFKKFRSDASARFEDGTINYLNIIALRSGFQQINKLGIMNISRHTMTLTKFLVSNLRKLKHANGTRLVQLYGHYTKDDGIYSVLGQGPIVAFNLIRPNGNFIGYSEVEKLSNLYEIHLRTGCFCNPGACVEYLQLTEEQVKLNFEKGHVCWDDNDIIEGKPTGAVRVSIPYMCTQQDILYFLKFLEKCFLSPEPLLHHHVPENSNTCFPLISTFVYPIKSCDGFEIHQPWLIVTSGLKHDREWALVEGDKQDSPYVNQKRFPALGQIATTIGSGQLVVTAPGSPSLEISLDEFPEDILGCRVCGDETTGLAYEHQSEWFSKFIGFPLSLIRHNLEGPQRKAKNTQDTNNYALPQKSPTSVLRSMANAFFGSSAKDAEAQSILTLPQIAFANESQFLVIASASLTDLKSRLDEKDTAMCSFKNFRPNFYVKTTIPFEEDDWERIKIGDQYFVASGPCNRCRMTCIDPNTLQIGLEPLKTLSTFRRTNGKILFGMLFVHDQATSPAPHIIHPSDTVQVISRKNTA